MTKGKESIWNYDSLIEDIKLAYSREGLEDDFNSEIPAITTALKKIHARIGSRRYCPYTMDSVFGVGGSGIVLRLQDRLFPQNDVALKFPRPVSGKIEILSELLEKELSHLSSFKHPGVVNILFYAVITEGVSCYNGRLPFYIMEAVIGNKSNKYINSGINELQFINLAIRTAKIIRYLHNHSGGQFAHLDIKPDNIVVAEVGRPIIIDLGTCKRISSDTTPTILACTQSYAHPMLLRYLQPDPTDENRSRGELPREAIKVEFDLYSYGLTLLTWLGFNIADFSIPNKNTAIIYRISPYTRKYILLLIARLLGNYSPNILIDKINVSMEFIAEIEIKTSDELVDVLERLYPERGPLNQLDEFISSTDSTMQAASGQHVVNTKRLQTTIEHRLFRRLNTITQLGLAYQVYPGAKQTRREHSLGTYANVIIIIRALYSDPVCPIFRQIVTKKDVCAILLTALLHDLGQFPMAHDLEEYDNKLFNHNDITKAMLRGKWEKKKRGARAITFESLEDVFTLWETSTDDILEILAAKPTSTGASRKSKLYRSLISGPIDADKLDYLIRDGRQLNLPYPAGIDIDRIIRCLTTVIIDKIKGGSTHIPYIGIHAKGRVAAEFVSFVRYTMFCQAYWHHAVRAQKAMLFRALSSIVNNLPSENKLMQLISDFVEMIKGLPESLYIKGPSEERLFNDQANIQKFDMQNILGQGTDFVATDAAVLNWFRHLAINKKLSEAILLDGILKRKLYKRIWILSSESDQRRWHKIIELWDKLDRKQRHTVYVEFEQIINNLIQENPQDVTNMKAESGAQLVNEKSKARIPWLLIDIPEGRPGSEIGLYSVEETQGRKLKYDDRAVGQLRLSSVWQHYADNLRQAAGKVRIFCDPDILEFVDTTVKMEIAMEELVSLMERIIT